MNKRISSAIKDLKDSATVLSLMVENSAKITNKKLLLEHLETLSNQTKRIKKVISSLESVQIAK